MITARTEKTERISVEEASEILGISGPAIRARMRAGVLPIGRVIKMGKRGDYLIYKSLVLKEVGRSNEYGAEDSDI